MAFFYGAQSVQQRQACWLRLSAFYRLFYSAANVTELLFFTVIKTAAGMSCGPFLGTAKYQHLSTGNPAIYPLF